MKTFILVVLLAGVFPVGSIAQTVECSGGTGDKAEHGGTKILNVASDTFPPCQVLLQQGISYVNNNEYLKGYDTLKKFIETCPLWQRSWSAFIYMDDAVQSSSPDSVKWVQFRSWLKSVLYLNTVDPEYFCQCVETIAGTFYSPSDSTPQLESKATNTGLAVFQWLLQHTNCDTATLRKEYTGSRFTQRYNWQHDTTAYALDTTLPSMHDLGLDSLLQIHLQLSVSKPTLFTNILQAFSLTQNPFQTNTLLRFNLNSMAYVRTAVFDELGRMVIGDGTGKVFESGEHQLPIDLSKFASGVYYLRISLADGEARTLKMVKKE